jgi:DNA-binding CsgD family transcriptional regulator
MSPHAMLQSRGRLMREGTASEDFEQSRIYSELLRHYGVRWGLCATVHFGEGSAAGFLSIYRAREAGPYSEADQVRLDKVAAVMCDFDRQANPLAKLPAAGYREAVTSSLLLHRDGRILGQSPEARDMLFLARRTGMGPPEWTRPDWHALPAEVSVVVEEMFAETAPSLRRELLQKLDWGRFDFVLEKMPLALDGVEPIISVTIRHHEPLDIAVARSLWGWPFSPQEKRILIASARNPGRAQLAQTLGLAEGTLKEYINDLQSRMGVASRQEMIDRVLGTR